MKVSPPPPMAFENSFSRIILWLLTQEVSLNFGFRDKRTDKASIPTGRLDSFAFINVEPAPEPSSTRQELPSLKGFSVFTYHLMSSARNFILRRREGEGGLKK